MSDEPEYIDLITGKPLEPWAAEAMRSRASREPVADHIGGEGEKEVCTNPHCPGCMEPDDEDDFATPPNPTGDAVREALEALVEAYRNPEAGERDRRLAMEDALATLAKHGGAEA